MKKYLWVLLPVIACSLLAYIYGAVAEADYHLPTYPFRTSEVLEFLSGTWFLAGAVLSAVLLVFFIMNDSTLLIGRIVSQRRAKKTASKQRFSKMQGKAKQKAGSRPRR
jgi:hypothetical protein